MNRDDSMPDSRTLHHLRRLVELLEQYGPFDQRTRAYFAARAETGAFVLEAIPFLEHYGDEHTESIAYRWWRSAGR